jgi:thiosulfate dehydrogenase (quinone) large subunit
VTFVPPRPVASTLAHRDRSDEADLVATTQLPKEATMTLHRSYSGTDHPELNEISGSLVTTTATRALAVLRIATGFVFLWAFLDKTFGLHYSTTSARAWIHGGSPAGGFLKSVDVGPFQSTFHSIAGTWWTDWLFMLGMFGVGVALVAGVALRAAAAAGVIIMAMMWFAEFPFAQHTSTGTASASTNPLTDYHFIYAASLVVIAATYAGNTWGLGRVWARLPFINRHAWAL